MKLLKEMQIPSQGLRRYLVEPGDVNKVIEVAAYIANYGCPQEESLQLDILVNDPAARDEPVPLQGQGPPKGTVRLALDGPVPLFPPGRGPSLAEQGKAVDTPVSQWLQALRPGETALERVRGPQPIPETIDGRRLGPFLFPSLFAALRGRHLRGPQPQVPEARALVDAPTATTDTSAVLSLDTLGWPQGVQGVQGCVKCGEKDIRNLVLKNPTGAGMQLYCRPGKGCDKEVRA